MLENKKETYIKTVKHNLRTFLLTAGYKIDSHGSFDTRDELGEIKFGTLADFRRKLFLKIDDKDNSFFITEPDKKLKGLFSDESKSLDPYFIKEICDMYNLPIGEIYSSNKATPEQAKNTMFEVSNQTLAAKKPFSVLSKDSHGAYFTTFYGFTLDHNPNEEEKIIDFTLSIFEDENGLPKAEYVFYNRRNKKQIFSGTPYYLTEQNAIAIEMSANNNRRYQYLYFCAPEHSTVVYKHGVCVRTSTVSKPKEPDVKSFIITGFKPGDSVKNVVPGLLKMSAESFYILATKLHTLEAENAELKAFHEKHNSNFVLIENSVYLVNELAILESTNRKSDAEKCDAFACLNAIKAVSLLPNKIIYRNTDADYKYFKKLENIKEK